MPETESKELKVREKQELASASEQTRAGLVFTPDVDIFETDAEITLLADMPGVAAGGLTIDLRDDTLTLMGDVEETDLSGREMIVSEYQVGRYYRQFTLSEIIDQEKIDAKLDNGVLRLTLPKMAKAKPRQITVRTA